jgi:signal transduction histidine kinase
LSEQPVLARALSSPLVAILGLLAFSGATIAGELLSLPNLSLVSRMMLPASLLQVIGTVPSPPPLVRFFPAVIGLPYILCLVAAGFAFRSASGLPEAREAAEALGTVLLLGTQAGLVGRMLAEARRSGIARCPWRVWATLCGAAVSLGGYLAWLSVDHRSGLALAAFLPIPASVATWAFARAPWEKTRLPRAAMEASTPLEEVARRMAHAILKPVTAVSEQLRLVAPTIDDPSNRAVLENASQLMGQVQRLVRDLLDLARAQGEPDRRALDLSKLIDQAALELRSRHPAAEVDMDTTSGTLVADEVGLRCLLLNLLENAVEARPPGWVRVQTAWSGGWVQIVVEDRAGGVASEVQERIFEPFVTTKQRGTGLGLAVVQEVSRTHGGRVVPQPTPEGTRFVVTLPVAS